MIIIKLQGGLGNQMFQYALGYAWKERFNKQIQFDIDHFEDSNQIRFTKRKLELEIFNIDHFKKSPRSYLKRDLFSKGLYFLQKKITKYHKRYYVEEQYYGFDENILKISHDCYLDGFWQSPKYFEGVEVQLREQFAFIKNLTPNAYKISRFIKASDCSISIHIRRGDYLTDYKTFYISQTIEYYLSAVEYIAVKVKNYKLDLFIFSDDIEWCKKEITLPYNTTFVDNDGLKDYEGMILMSQCNHHIIANSSYSWWGAWLDNKPDKIVVCTKSWFINPDVNSLFIKDIYPESFIKL